MEAYTGFAQVYDQFMEDVPYEDWLNIIHTHLKNEAIEDGLILDLGCGTGTMTRLLADQGYDMIGIDGSEEMLMEARAAEYDLEQPADPLSVSGYARVRIIRNGPGDRQHL